MIDQQDLKTDLTFDMPKDGAWHKGPKSCWVCITHLPTMISVRAYNKSQQQAYQAALTCLEMLVGQAEVERCSFPEQASFTIPTQRETEPEQA